MSIWICQCELEFCWADVLAYRGFLSGLEFYL